VNFLLDANVILDRALKRARHVEVDELFSLATGDQLSVSRFSLHAVGWYMTPRNRDGFRLLLKDLSDAGVSVVDLSMVELISVVDAMDRFKLDFDDAFNCAVAEKLDLMIVSSDVDFDRTPRGRLTLDQAVTALRKSQNP